MNYGDDQGVRSICIVALCFKSVTKFLHYLCILLKGGARGGMGRGGGGGLFGFGQTTAKVIKDDVGVRFK